MRTAAFTHKSDGSLLVCLCNMSPLPKTANQKAKNAVEGTLWRQKNVRKKMLLTGFGAYSASMLVLMCYRTHATGLICRRVGDLANSITLRASGGGGESNVLYVVFATYDYLVRAIRVWRTEVYMRARKRP